MIFFSGVTFDNLARLIKRDHGKVEKKSRGDNDKKMRIFPLRRGDKIARDDNLIHLNQK